MFEDWAAATYRYRRRGDFYRRQLQSGNPSGNRQTIAPISAGKPSTTGEKKVALLDESEGQSPVSAVERGFKKSQDTSRGDSPRVLW